VYPHFIPGRMIRHTVDLILRLGGGATCLVGIFWSYKIVRADNEFRKDTAQSVRAAIALIPDQPTFYVRLAQLDSDHVEPLLEKALSISPYSSKAEIDLGLLREAQADYASAEKLLLQAFDVDRTYLTRWTLANYYYRRDDMPRFWHWARMAVEMPAEDIQPLFQLCWRATPDPSMIEKSVLTDDPTVMHQFLEFLLEKKELGPAAAIAERLVQLGRLDTDRPLLISLVNGLIAVNDAPAAVSVWRSLARGHWIVADASLPFNAAFTRVPLSVGFDWRLFSYDGVHTAPGSAGLQVEFSGKEPEACLIAEQMLPLQSGRHQFAYRYRTVDIFPDTGLQWKAVDANLGTVLGSSPDLSNASPRVESFEFQTSEALALVRIRLQYRRPIGTRRLSGLLVVTATNLETATR
jgi:tetratricopeptide (TPR) repeat protein